MVKRLAILAVAGLAASTIFALGPASVAIAAPSHGVGSNPGVRHNPNGPPPIGKPATNGDTDRGHSGGKGNNERPGTTHVVGVVRAISGDMVSVRNADGTVQILKLTPAQAAELWTSEHVVIFNSGAQVTKVEPADVILRGVVTHVDRDKTTVTVRLPNGKLRTVTVAPEAAENMLHREGRPVVVSTHTAFTTPALIQVIGKP